MKGEERTRIMLERVLIFSGFVFDQFTCQITTNIVGKRQVVAYITVTKAVDVDIE